LAKSQNPKAKTCNKGTVMEKLPVSVILATRNEEKNIEACLQSVSWAEEVIVVDGSSEDKTAELAKQFTEKVIVVPASTCEEQRLVGLKEVTQPWFFLIDADERVSEDLKLQIKQVLTSAPHSAYYFLRRNYLKDKPIHFGHPDYQLRLFNKQELLELPEKIHRFPKVKGSTGNLEGELIHYFFESVSDYIEKINFYTEKEARYCLQKPNFKPSLLRMLLKPPARFFQNYFLKKAFLDGYWGLVFSFGAAYYEMLVNLRVLMSENSMHHEGCTAGSHEKKLDNKN